MTWIRYSQTWIKSRSQIYAHLKKREEKKNGNGLSECVFGLWSHFTMRLWLRILVSSCWHRVLTPCHSTVSENIVYRRKMKQSRCVECPQTVRTYVKANDGKNGGSARKDEFKLVQIYICHLNHHKNSSTFKLFRKCPIWKPKFWRTSYKWMCALSWLIGRSVGCTKKNQNKKLNITWFFLGIVFCCCFCTRMVYAHKKMKRRHFFSVSVFVYLYLFFFGSQCFFFSRWIYHKNTMMSNICAFIDDNLWFKRRQTEFA